MRHDTRTVLAATLVVVLVLALAACLVGCGKKQADAGKGPTAVAGAEGAGTKAPGGQPQQMPSGAQGPKTNAVRTK